MRKDGADVQSNEVRHLHPTSDPAARVVHTFDREMLILKRRLVREARYAIAMLERSLDALWRLDAEAAMEVRLRDDRVDEEEVAIEQDCYRLLALKQPVARDFRIIAFILKVNADVERVADHASSIAKIAKKMRRDPPPRWPQSLREMGERVPLMCYQLLRAVMSEDAASARAVVEMDETIDQLNRQLFGETVEMMRRDPEACADGLLISRAGRELERVGDLMTNIAEDVVFLATGEIIRHQRRREAAARAAKTPPRA
ncbi:MAG: phosphate signaling complex protein PhoU [Phycisphaeraceae bacterium]|nr:phosphate signaling complex protein PhoU [Phycisphaeraceae bacterium]